MSNVIVDGIIFSFGSMIPAIKDGGGDEIQVSNIAWIGSLLTGFYLLGGMFA